MSKLLPRSTRSRGIVVLVVLVLVGVAAFQRERIVTTVSPGDTITAEFSRVYKLEPYRSAVKIAGVKVGVVTGVDTTDRRTALVDLQLDSGVIGKLGGEPSAAIRPTLVVGGQYYVELSPGGMNAEFQEDQPIPVERTSVPVELDQVLTSLTPDARDALQGTVGELDETLRAGGKDELRRFLEESPRTLASASDVLNSARGTRPDTDLTRLVTGLQQTSAALTAEDGRFESIIDSLDKTAAALASQRDPVARALATGPETLRATRAGLTDLDTTLPRLATTAKSFRPTARRLDPLLAELDPVLAHARPVVRDARAVLRDARPLVGRLVPTAEHATGALTDVRGPVLERLNGPVLAALNSPWHGEGAYQSGGNDHPLYQETAYLLSHGADVFKFHDHNGALGRLMAGVGLSTAGGGAGVQMPLEQYLETLGLQQPPGPQEGTTEGAPGLIPPPAAGNDAGGPGSILPPLRLPLVSGGY